jgi:radical SAM protein with 4Fe4S-binding SPASM domain
MANICITGVCNRACPYCFAGFNVDGASKELAYMSWEIYLRALEYALRSGMDHVRLLGGEPTIHPQFPRMLAEALNRNLAVRVFSNGLMPEPALAALEEAPAERIVVLLNVNLLPGTLQPDIQSQRRVLERLSSRVTVGLNVSEPSHSQPYPLLELIRRYGLAPTIRVGIAHPRLGGTNAALHPRYYPVVGRNLAKFMEAAKNEGISVGLDCGFVPCMFPEDVQELLRDQQFGSTACHPILDILPSGDVIACYPLEKVHRVPLGETSSAQEVGELFRKKLGPLRTALLLAECSECAAWRRQACLGGCLAASLRRMRGNVPGQLARRVPEAPAIMRSV